MRHIFARADGMIDPSAAESVARSPRPIRILHVEDDDTDARIVAHFLESLTSATLSVERVCGVEEALSRLDAGAYDLCLLDCWLDAQSSLQIVTRIDAMAAPVPIVLLSGAVGPEVREFALMSGAADFVLKNELSASRLARAIETALTRRGPKPAA